MLRVHNMWVLNVEEGQPKLNQKNHNQPTVNLISYTLEACGTNIRSEFHRIENLKNIQNEWNPLEIVQQSHELKKLKIFNFFN